MLKNNITSIKTQTYRTLDIPINGNTKHCEYFMRRQENAINVGIYVQYDGRCTRTRLDH